jgi:hypothetical protein
MSTDLVSYLTDAISRAEAGGVTSPTGSWLAGMYGRAANLFERQMSLRVTGLLAVSGLKYPEDLGDAVKGTPPYEKLTLGQLVAVIREAGRRRPEIAARHLPGRRPLSRFLEEILTVNATWVDTKHGEDVEEKILLARMRTMLKLAKLLSNESSAGTTPNQPMEPTGFAGGS